MSQVPLNFTHDTDTIAFHSITSGHVSVTLHTCVPVVSLLSRQSLLGHREIPSFTKLKGLDVIHSKIQCRIWKWFILSVEFFH